MIKAMFKEFTATIIISIILGVFAYLVSSQYIEENCSVKQAPGYIDDVPKPPESDDVSDGDRIST